MTGPEARKTVLIVDDVELFVQLQISHLGRRRFDIHTANSGEDGLEAARSLKPDLILLDLLMPDMNGDQVCRILKGDPETSPIPVVIVSSGTREHSRTTIQKTGCDGLLFKPVRRDLLISVVESLLGTSTRSFERIDANIPCTVSMDGTQHEGTVRSLSNTGAFIETHRGMVRGDMVELVFTLPGSESATNVRAAAVVWCGSLKEGGPAGAGVQFLTISGQSQMEIAKFIRSRMEAGLVLEGEDG